MRNVIISFVIAAVLTATSLAVVTNPEEFEGYAVTDPWNPTEAVEGWTAGGANPDLKINTAAALDGSKGLQSGTVGAIAAGTATWYATLGADQQVFDVDFYVVYGGPTRIAFNYGNFSGAYVGAFSAEFSTWSNGSAGKLQHHDGFGYVITNIPGASHYDYWADHVWHHLTVEMDFTNHTARARFDDNAWTPWVAMPNGDGAGTYPHDNITMNLDGINYIDNMKLTASNGLLNPEPFEDYFDTTDWQPTQANDGWTITDASAEIGSYGQTGKGLKLNDTAQGQWYATYDPYVYLLQTFTVDFKSTATSGGERDIILSAGDADQGAFNLEIENGAEHDAWFEHYNVTTSSYDKTYLPNANNWTADAWHTLTVEMDFSTHTVRAKLDDNGFTGWVHMPQDDTGAPGPAYSYTHINTNASAGTFNLDNYHLSTPGWGGLSNPDTFEDYVLTDDWNPTEADQGWTGDTGADLQIATAAAFDGSKGLRSGRVGAIAAGQATWYATLDDVAMPLQRFDVDFNVVHGGADRISFGYGGPYDGAFTIEFSTWSNGGVAKLQADDGGGIVTTNLPGTENGWPDWANQTWHHVTVEMDFTTHTVRARFDDNAWTAWVPMPEGGGGGIYAHSNITMNLDGIHDIDNMQLTASSVPPPDCPAAIDAGYRLYLDFNHDCYVNLIDLALLAENWSNCMVPNVPGCQTPWIPQ